MLAIKRSIALVLLLVIIIFVGGSYFVLRIDNISNATVVLLTMSLIILPPLGVYWLLIRPKHVPNLLGYLVIILSLGASYLIIPSSRREFFNGKLVWLLPALEVGILFLVLYSVFKSVRSYRRNKRNKEYNLLEIIRLSLEPQLGNGFILAALLTELSVFYYSIGGWFRKPSVFEGEKTYTYHKTSQLKTIVIIFSILIVVEGVLLHFLIQSWSSVAAWIFTILNIYALLYMIGLNNSVRLLPHSVNFDRLIIRFGYQSNIELDIRNIKSIRAATEQGGIGEKKPKDTYFAMLNMDSPQYEILLTEPAIMNSSYGRKKYVNTVVFRTDEPVRMVEEITAKMGSLSDDK